MIDKITDDICFWLIEDLRHRKGFRELLNDKAMAEIKGDWSSNIKSILSGHDVEPKINESDQCLSGKHQKEWSHYLDGNIDIMERFINELVENKKRMPSVSTVYKKRQRPKTPIS